MRSKNKRQRRKVRQRTRQQQATTLSMSPQSEDLLDATEKAVTPIAPGHPDQPLNLDSTPPNPKGLLLATEEPGVCVVFGDADLRMDFDFGQFRDFTLMPDDSRVALGGFVEQAVTTGNLGIKVIEGTMRARGLVQLSPETIQAFSTGARTLQQGGWNIGTLAGPGGKFVSTVKWLPAGAGATVLTVASSAGAALALMALQWQLNRIESLAQRALEVAAKILDEICSDQRNEVAAIEYALRQAMSTAQKAGAVTDFVWEDIGGQRIPIDLRRLSANALSRLQRQSIAVRKSRLAKERFDWVAENGSDILQDVITLAYAFVASCRYEAMRLARASRKYAGIDVEEAAIGYAHEQAKRELVKMRNSLEPVLAALWKYLSLLCECPGAGGWQVWAAAKTRGQTQEKARDLRDSLANICRGIGNMTLTEPPIQEVLGKRFSALRWLLDDDEEVMMGSSDGCANFFFGPQEVVATTHRIVVLKDSEFPTTGVVESERSLESCIFTIKDDGSTWQVDFLDTSTGDERLPLHRLRFAKADHSRESIMRRFDALWDAHDKRVELLRQPPSARAVTVEPT